MSTCSKCSVQICTTACRTNFLLSSTISRVLEDLQTGGARYKLLCAKKAFFCSVGYLLCVFNEQQQKDCVGTRYAAQYFCF